MTEAEKRSAVKEFLTYWKGRGYEKGESQKFWLSLLSKVFGVEDLDQFIFFEDRVMLDHTSFIDGSIPSTHVLIEQKSVDKDLRKPIRQADGSTLTPFQQAKRYSQDLPYSMRPRWIVTCNFREFLVYDMEIPSGEPESILLEDLEKEYHRLNFLVDTGDEGIRKEMEVSIQAGSLVGVLYDAILHQYHDQQNPDSLKSLNMLCVRLVFCLYAEDAGIFGRHSQFHNYLNRFEARDIRRALIDLFHVLDTALDERDHYLDDNLKAFPYVNGGLFSDENIEIPQFTDRIKHLLIHDASEDFNWSEISPTIFGAVFESTLNPETRRSGGMHYTSIENIHKVIDPLFLDSLKEELQAIKDIPLDRTRQGKLKEYQKKLASYTFLDPACGSGNFLTETFLCLRRLENETLRCLIDLEKGQTSGQIMFGITNLNPIMVSIGQFYGIEINDFAVTVARTALWIAEAQMLTDTEQVVHMNLDFLPLKTYDNIHEGNALLLDWDSIISCQRLNFIMGNPPFSGARVMSKNQKEDLNHVFCNQRGVGNLDYVSAWFKKSADFMFGTTIIAAYVSTNSISQGEQPAILWLPIIAKGMEIIFARQSFKWASQSNDPAAVHCVIIGFTHNARNIDKKIFVSEQSVRKADSINAYLLDAPNVFIESRSRTLNGAPSVHYGSFALDDGNFTISEREYLTLCARDNRIKRFLRPFCGAQELIHNQKRFCIWLKGVPPEEINASSDIKTKVENVQKWRSSSERANTRALAMTPSLFAEIRQPDTRYLAIPTVCSEHRRYLPMMFLPAEVIASNQLYLVDDATIYQFGILMSNVHMAWMRAVAGRLEMRYRYSANIVYNNFPWPTPTSEQTEKIKQTAQAILDARTLYPDSSLADLYDEVTMPPELRKAHQNNDRAVMQLYGFAISTTEPECVAELMKMYQKFVR